jgi:Leucine-rich repeat (LRR) protein
MEGKEGKIFGTTYAIKCFLFLFPFFFFFFFFFFFYLFRYIDDCLNLFIVLSQSLPKLKILNFSNSFLIKTPDFTEAPNLEKLIFEGCSMLYEVHPSVGGLKRLTLLNLGGCTSLHSLPCNISLDSLDTLILSGCSKLEKVSEIVGNMKHLKKLHLDATPIKEVPLSIGRLSGLTLLNLRDCIYLTSLPCNISLDSIEVLILSGCFQFEKVPKIVGNMKCLKELQLGWTAIKELPSSIGHLSCLTLLDLRGCTSLTSLPCNFSLDSLEVLILSDCSKLEKVPETVGNMKHLKKLHLDGSGIKEVPLSIERLSGFTSLLNLEGCTSLTSFPCNINLDFLDTLILSGCSKLEKIPKIVGNMKRLKKLLLDGSGIKEVPSSIERLSSLTLLNLRGCTSLTSLPCNFSLDSLEDLILSDCSKLEKFSENVENMKRLKELKLDGTAIKELPLSIGHLSSLVLLNLAFCNSLLTLPSVICNLTSLQCLSLVGCSKVDKLPKDLGNLKQLKVLLVWGTAIRQLPSLPSSIQCDFGDAL